MKYETRKRRLKKLLRPAPWQYEHLAECCGSEFRPAHRYALTACECGRRVRPADPPPARVRRLLDPVSEQEQARLIREIVIEFMDERKAAAG